MWIFGRWVGPLLEGEGNGGASWLGAVPEAIRSSPSLQKFKGVDALAQSYVELESTLGNSIRIPGPEAGPDLRKQFLEKLQAKVPELVLVPENSEQRAQVEEGIYRKLGLPKDATAYAMPKDVPVGVQLDEAGLRAAAFSLGLTQKQFEKFITASAMEQLDVSTKRAAAETALKAKWGAAHDERVALARAAAGRLGIAQEAVKSLSPEQLEVWWEVSKAVAGEPGGTEGSRQGGAGRGTPDPGEAARQAAEIRNRPEYWDGSKPNHATLVAEHTRLMKLAHPEE